ncbi:hypothetical protein G9A89_017966 [Geosiphon pyriformis]|nr:hypothetical protein G9A89_017966 [Geosiphon pyriformis]
MCIMAWIKEKQETVYGYRLNSHFVFKIGWVESQAGLTSFLATSAFVDDTIWVGNSQLATQHILNIASDFFKINDISINNEKTVAIPINCQVVNPTLNISGLPISVAKKEEPHHYLGIFLSSEGLSRPSLVRVHSDVWFFTNLVLRKAISDKQFTYLVSAVLVPIISYRTQFNALIRKGLKSKSGLPLDFPNDALYYSSLYGLKTFEQIQAESKSASIVSFANSVDVLDTTSSFIGLLFLDGGASHDILQSYSSLCRLETRNMKAGAAVFFENFNLGLGLDINWVKVKSHFGIMDNKCADEFAKTAAFSDFCLPSSINERFSKSWWYYGFW